jgi:hypothetical protein
MGGIMVPDRASQRTVRAALHQSGAPGNAAETVSGGDDLHAVVGLLREGVDHLAVRIQMAKQQGIVGHLDMREAVDLLGEGPTLRLLDLQVVEVRATAAREEKRGRD